MERLGDLAELFDRFRQESHAEITALKAELARLRSTESGETALTGQSHELPSDDDVRTDRRGLFKVGGAAAVAAVGTAVGTGLVSATPASAASGDNLVLGQSNSATSLTFLDASTTSGLIGFQCNVTGQGSLGLYGATAGGIGVQGSDLGTTSSEVGLGLYGTSVLGTGVLGTSAGASGVGVLAQNSGGGIALVAESGTASPQLQLVPTSTVGPPASGSHNAGEILFDADGVLHLCTVAGTPGSWVTLVTQASAPSLTTGVGVPSAGATLSGNAWLDAVASADSGVSRVAFMITGGQYNQFIIGTATPTYVGYLFLWNTNTVPNGTYTLQSLVTDKAGNVFASNGITITVSN
jgi:hypothetical protein